jgi:hypothetical protein
MITDISTFEGSEAEKLFVATALKKNHSVIRKATPSEDMNQHWDFLLSDRNGLDLQFTVDVKAHKHKWRNGPLLENYYWVEWKNVRGNNGWLDGQADYIAFIYFNNIYFYNRKDLRDAAAKLVNFNKKVNKASLSLNCIYTRKDRKDQVSMISILDLHKITKPSIIWSI